MHSVAAWNDTAWSDVGGGVVNSNAPTVVASVNALCVHDSDLIVGGYLTHGGFVPANNICRFDGNNWFALGTGVAADPFSLLSWDSTLYIGGPFSSAGGITGTKRVAKWINNQWMPVSTDILLGVTYSFAVYDSVLYAGGSGYSINGQNASGIVRLLNYPDTFPVDTTSIGKLILADKQLRVFPNPATEKLTIDLNSNCSNCKLEIINTLGEKMISQSIQKNKTEIDVSQLPQGVYFLMVESKNGSVGVSKFLKE